MGFELPKSQIIEILNQMLILILNYAIWNNL
jgi:hypothetical protein